MGHSSSSLSSDERFKWDPYQERQIVVFDKINNPIFFYEKYISFFIDVNHGIDFFHYLKKHKHKAEYLVKLIIGFYEELEDIPHILETIIESEIEPENDIIKYLCNCFYCYTQNAENRTILFHINSDFSNKFFSAFKIKSLKQMENHEQPSFPLLLASISASISILEDHRFPYQSLISFLDFFANSLTYASITPPSPEFLPDKKYENVIENKMFTADYVNPHGICSNGKFLFILCSNNVIQIFPLINGGSLSSLIVADLSKIGVEIPQDASLNIEDNNVQIIYNDKNECKMITIDIDSLVKNKISSQVNITSYEFNCKCSCSDGITQIIIEQNNSLRAYDLFQKKLLAASFLDQSEVELPDDLSTIVVETNGSCISFIMQNRDDLIDIVDNNDSIRNNRNIFNSNNGNNGSNNGINNNVNSNSNSSNNNYAIYLTYSFDGSILRIEKFRMDNQIIASCVDSVNKCHWSVIAEGNSHFYVRRYSIVGGENPEIFGISHYIYNMHDEVTPLSFVCQIISSLHRHLRALINSQISPDLFLIIKINDFFKMIELFHKIISIADDKFELFEECKQAAIESMIILISLNLKRIGCMSKPDDSIIEEVVNIIKKLPLNLASILFFSNFNYLIYNQNEDALFILYGLLDSMKNDNLIMFAFRMMENSESLSMIDFQKSRLFFNLIPQDFTKSSSMNPTFFMFLFLHQRVLVRDSLLFLKNNHFAVIDFLNKSLKTKSVLDLLSDYIQFMFSVFEKVFSDEQNEIEDLAFYDLFSNFMILLSSLTEFHSISQITTAFISININKLIKLFDICPKEIFNIIFILGKLASTLLKGDEISNIEKKIVSLIASNMDLISNPDMLNNIDNEEIEQFEDERINDFLEYENNSMVSLYKKIKPLVNKNLNYQIKQIDRLSLITFAKHLNCIDELLFFDESCKPSTQLRCAFEQMLIVRNEFRRFLQNKKDTKIFKIKCLILLRLKNLIKPENPKNLSDFVIMKFEPNYFKKVISGQRKRTQTTLAGFALLDQTYDLNLDPIIYQILNYNLSLIKSFESMDLLIKTSKLNKIQENQILIFFSKLIRKAIDSNSNQIIMVCFRFFRDIDCLNNVKNVILNLILNILESNPNKYSLFALSLSLIKGITKIPNQILKIENKNHLYRWTLLYEATKNVLPPKDFAQCLTMYFWDTEIITKMEEKHALSIIYNIQELITDYELFFSTCFLYIGRKIKKMKISSRTSEIINFYRKILINDSAPLKLKLTDYILKNNLKTVNKKLILGILSVLGLNYEKIHNYSIINHHPTRSELNQYYIISFGKNEFKLYSRPFDLDSSIVSINVNDNCYAVPRVDLIPEKFPYYDYILNYLNPFYEYLNSKSLIHAIYMQVFASFCRSPIFISKIPENILFKLCNKPAFFHDIQETIEYINHIRKFKIIPMMSYFNVFSSHKKKIQYTTFLSPVIKENAEAFEIIIKFSCEPSEKFYLGIVSDNLEPNYTRYSLVSLPNGNIFPSISTQNPFVFNEIGKTIKIKINNKKKEFVIYNRVFRYPIGINFRFLVAANLKKIDIIDIDVNSDFYIFKNDSISPFLTFENSQSEKLYDLHRLYKIPKELPYDYKKLPDFVNVLISHPKIEKYIFTPPPLDIIIHGYDSTEISRDIFNSLISGAFEKLAHQYSTIALMRAINLNIKIDKFNVFKLFQCFIYLTESFSIPLMQQNNFPFDITVPIWGRDIDPTYFSFENEAKNALKRIISDVENISLIADGIKQLSNSILMHSLMLPQKSLELFINAPKEINLSRNKSYLLFNSDISNASNDSVKINSNTTIKLPNVCTVGSKNNLIKIIDRKRPIGYLGFNTMNNDWLINTPIELLLLLKNFVFIATNEEHQTMIKSIILNCFIINSPAVSFYLNQFIDFIQTQIPLSMNDQGNDYSIQLALTGSRLKLLPNQNFINFYQREQKLLYNRVAAELSFHFPEFLAASFPPPKTKQCQIPFVEIDPGNLTPDFYNHISTLRIFYNSYHSLVGFPFWEILPYWIKVTDIKYTVLKTESDLKIKTVCIDRDQIHDQFVNDMKQFAMKWNENDTYELLNQIPLSKFSNAKFDEVKRVALSSYLTTKYNSTVVVLRALILHHYNYIYVNHYNKVSIDIWSKTIKFLSIEKQSNVVLSNILNGDQKPNLTINRQISQILVVDKCGDRRNSIISQLTVHILRNGISNFRNKNRPWSVTYSNERGIDAGGLTRDLLVEASASIFQPTSKLMVQVDASTNDENRILYVPNEKSRDCFNEFYIIGALIGIIIRTGLVQDLPFAPFIWKWIAGELITDDDILESDRHFRQFIDDKKRKINSNDFNWNVICWNGSIVDLNNRNSHADHNANQYQSECIEFRKRSIKPMLDRMKSGFFDNTGINLSVKLSGRILSILAQGTGIITVEQLKRITRVYDFNDGMNNPVIKRFWRVVERFNNNELKLLLKFITSLTRFPNESRLNSRFEIIIDRLNCRNPNSMHPTASTCFNRLHLPGYTNDEAAYSKILYAVKYCSSMENS